MSQTPKAVIALSIFVLLCLASRVLADNVSYPYSFTAGTPIESAKVNANFNAVSAAVNGQLDNANLKSGAAIAFSKLAAITELFVLRSATSRCLSAGTTGDTVPRISMNADGHLLFGPGSGAAIDTRLKRDAAGILRIRDASDAADAGLRLGNLYLNGNVVSDMLAQACIPGGRLTLTSGTPVTGDVTGATNIYYAIYKHNLMPAYSAAEGKVVLRSFTEITISLAGLAANTNFDVYAKWNGSAWVGSTVAWAGATTRAATVPTRLTNSQLYVSSADSEAMWLGTIRTTGTIGQTSKSRAAGQLYVWNLHNRVLEDGQAQDTTSTWTYTTAAYQEARAQATEGTSRIGIVRGADEDSVEAVNIAAFANSSANIPASVGIGIDSTTNVSLNTTTRNPGANLETQCSAQYKGKPGIGYRTFRRLEQSNATGTCTWHGNNGSALVQAGMRLSQLM